MGWFLSLTIVSIRQEEKEFICDYDVMSFHDKVYISWFKQVNNQIEDWTSWADNTLFLKFPPHAIQNREQYTVDRIRKDRDIDGWRYTDIFHLRDNVGLVHVILPPRHLPHIDLTLPFPNYLTYSDERAALGWIWEPNRQLRCSFREIEKQRFGNQVDVLSNLVDEGQQAALESYKELLSLDVLLDLYNDNRRELEFRKAHYGIETPLSVVNQLKMTQTHITSTEERKEVLLSRWRT